MAKSIEAARAVNELLHFSDKDDSALWDVIQDYFEPDFSDSGN